MAHCAEAIAVLVHGARAQNADWTKPGSKLRTSLEQTFKNKVTFEPFTWTGKNSLTSRHVDAERLAGLLKEITKDNPSKDLFVIGHSHGGNVALKAVELAGLFKEFNVACLSTPFLYVTPKLYDEALVQHIAGSFAIITGRCAFVFWWIFHKHLPWWFKEEWSSLATVALLVCVTLFLLRKPLDKWTTAAREQAAISSLDVPLFSKLLILRSVGDEAASAINVSQLLIPAIHYIHKASQNMERRASEFKIKPIKLRHEAWFMWALAICCLLLRATGAVGRILHFQFLPIESVLTIIIAAIAVAILIFHLVRMLNSMLTIPEMLISIAIYAVSKLIQVLSALAMVAVAALAVPTLGRDALMLGLLYRSMAEPTPLGFWGLHQFVPQLPGGLNHSAVYEDPAALSILCRWVESMLDSKKPSV